MPDRSVRPLGLSVDVIWQVFIRWLPPHYAVAFAFSGSGNVDTFLAHSGSPARYVWFQDLWRCLGVLHVVFYRINLYP